MKIAFLISRVLMQAALAQMILLAYSLYAVMDVPAAVTTTVWLVFFVGIFQTGLGIVFLRLGRYLKMVIIPLLTSLLTALTLTLYPSFGFTIDFWVLFGILFLAGIVSHGLLLGAGASWSDKRDD